MDNSKCVITSRQPTKVDFNSCRLSAKGQVVIGRAFALKNGDVVLSNAVYVNVPALAVAR